MTVDSSYRIDDAIRQVSLTVGDYDREQPLVIDPILTYATSLGGVAQDEGNAVAVDAAGNIYVAGFTRSPNFPANGTAAGQLRPLRDEARSHRRHRSCRPRSSAATAPTRRAASRSTPTATSTSSGVTRSTNFPTVSAIQGTLNGESDAFVLKISTTGGGLLFSTYLGGSGLDEGTGVAIDTARNVYVTGTTRSTNFPTASPRQGALGGNTDAFVAKLNPAGSALLYSSYLGGAATDIALGIAADGAGNVTVVGTTNSANFPAVRTRRRPTDRRPLRRVRDAESSPNGALIFSTFWGATISTPRRR